MMISSYLLCLVTLQTTQTDTAFMILRNRAMNQKWDFEIFIVLNNQYSPQHLHYMLWKYTVNSG